ncbi:hypothetical protein HG531_001512 [Fusarium graminearum]|nr:hypothetical protein HG531_001512 [Fusarium graminearum]
MLRRQQENIPRSEDVTTEHHPFRLKPYDQQAEIAVLHECSSLIESISSGLLGDRYTEIDDWFLSVVDDPGSGAYNVFLRQLLRLLLALLDTVVSKNWRIAIQIVHGIFLSIVVAEQSVEDATGNGRGDTNTDVEPQEVGVLGARSLGVGVLKTSDGDEDLRNTNKDVGGGLDSDVHVVGEVLAVDHTGRTVLGGLVAGSRRVDDVLDNSSVSETQSSEPETNGDTGNRSKLDSEASQDRVENLLDKRSENQNGDRIEVLHQIVRNAVAVHLTSLGDKVGGELSVANPEDGVEDKDLASTESTLELIDEVVVPGDSLGLAVGLAP